ncbi:cysteine protease ATG4B [Canna indica]|uniref:Cysteine protease n=1 Tax=Canna indica TaxID=4628 RepID=A0AAQ3Q3N0_9LILI|nr:cysteine protease ATG4B [Canna indica]
MTDLLKKEVDSESPAGNSDEPKDRNPVSADSEQMSSSIESSKASILANLFSSTLAIFESRTNSFSGDNKSTNTSNYGLTTAMTNAMISGPIRRLQERIMGATRTEALSSTSEIWLLGKCYKISPIGSSDGADPGNSYADFLEDYSSRIWITYRKGFDPIGDTKFTSDASWGCMIRSSQMLVAQALLFHHLGRSWRRRSQKPYEPKYIEILHLFGDSEACAFSIHNLLQAGRHYGLAAGSWLGPYAMCRTWETIARANNEEASLMKSNEHLPMVVYIVSGDEDGEQGGAPVICIDVATRLCSSFSMAQNAWAPILLLVPLVLGLEKVNPRYIPLLHETFTFPQSLGIIGGKPGVSTYIVGVQEDKALYLDPHEIQPAADIKTDNLESDCTSYHCGTVRHMPLDLIDPSLAIGFYCRDKDDFEDFCSRASQLGDKSNGAPLFTITQFAQRAKPVSFCDSADNPSNSGNSAIDNNFDVENLSDNSFHSGDEEWQIL